MDLLTKEEVLHVANLARIDVSEDEIDVYRKDLKELINEIDKIKNVEVKTEDILITPIEHETRVRNDEDIRNVPFDEIKKNIPKTVGNFVEVVVMIND